MYTSRIGLKRGTSAIPASGNTWTLPTIEEMEESMEANTNEPMASSSHFTAKEMQNSGQMLSNLIEPTLPKKAKQDLIFSLETGNQEVPEMGTNHQLAIVPSNENTFSQNVNKYIPGEVLRKMRVAEQQLDANGKKENGKVNMGKSHHFWF